MTKYSEALQKIKKTISEVLEPFKKMEGAVEIIKEKRVNVDYLTVAFRLNSCRYYNSIVSKARQLTQKQFDLLKEVLDLWAKEDYYQA